MRICVRTMVGELTQLDVDDGCTLSQLQHLIAQKLKIPSECQKLVIGDEILTDRSEANKENTINLHNRCDDHGCISVALVVSIDGVCSMIARILQLFNIDADEQRQRRPTFIEPSRLISHGPRQNEVDKEEMCPGTSLMCALNVISEFAHICSGNEQVLNVVIACLKYPQQHVVRVAALKLLPKVADQGNGIAIDHIIDCFNDECKEVKMAALEVIPAVAGKGHKEVFHRILLYWISDDSRGVRQAVLKAVENMAEKQDERELACIMHSFDDRSRQSRQECMLQALYPQALGAWLLRSVLDIGSGS